ncbi:hypothetical protein TNCV_3539371 [Trichonephila clavipes]|nr:hypothetical protein TNCV_3539371 [Trichonephila clavipes]
MRVRKKWTDEQTSNSKSWQWMTKRDVSTRQSTPALHGNECPYNFLQAVGSTYARLTRFYGQAVTSKYLGGPPVNRDLLHGNPGSSATGVLMSASSIRQILLHRGLRSKVPLRVGHPPPKLNLQRMRLQWTHEH